MIAAIRSAFSILGRSGFHYLDNAAMALTPEAVVQAVARHDRDSRANVRRGLHALARRADDSYDAARQAVAGFLSAKPEEVIFTGGCTQALNMGARMLTTRLGPGDRVMVTAAEHHSNLLPWLMLSRERGFAVERLPVTPEGRLDLSDLSAIGPGCKVVAVTQASNVTGAVTDLATIAAAAHAVGALVVVDGAQAVPHGPQDPRALGADLYAFAGHKAYGPTGIGVLWGRAELLSELSPVVWGGGMVAALEGDSAEFLGPPHGFEAGTPPIAQAVGLGAALTWMGGLDWDVVAGHERSLTGRLLRGLERIDGAAPVGPAQTDRRLPVVSFTLAGCHPHDVAHLLAERGVAVRGGHHCARPLMEGLGLADGCLRASLAPYTIDDDVDALLAGLAAAAKVLR